MENEKYGTPGKIESNVLDVINVVAPFPLFKQWIHAYFRPVDVLKAELGKGTHTASAKNFAIAGFLTALVKIISLVVLMLTVAELGAVLFVSLTTLVVFPIIAVVLGFIYSALTFAAARLLGGRGSFSDQTYVLSMIDGGAILLSLPILFLMDLPLGIIVSLFLLVYLVINLYALYSFYRLIKEVHQLSTLRAVAALLIPPIFVVLIIILLIILSALAMVSIRAL